jgi:hypothetical protein
MKVQNYAMQRGDTAYQPAAPVAGADGGTGTGEGAGCGTLTPTG